MNPPPTPLPTAPASDHIVAETRAWVDRAVIGLNLCPFAQPVQARNQVRYVVTPAIDPATLLTVLAEELELLTHADPGEVETTVLIHPQVLTDFLEFNAFLGDADSLVEELGLTGVIQVASFHPQFQFAGTEPDDITNATNRSPYPTLHLLREASVERALAGCPDPAAIYQRNIETLNALGTAGWAALQEQCRRDAATDGLRDGL